MHYRQTLLRRTLVSTLVLLVTLVARAAHAQSISLQWDPNTEADVAVATDSQSNDGVAVEIEPTGASGFTTPGTAPWMVHVNVCDVLRLPSDTLAVTVYVPAVVGVPPIAPVLDVSVNPGGRPVAENVTGRPSGSEPCRFKVSAVPAALV